MMIICGNFFFFQNLFVKKKQIRNNSQIKTVYVTNITEKISIISSLNIFVDFGLLKTEASKSKFSDTLEALQLDIQLLLPTVYVINFSKLRHVHQTGKYVPFWFKPIAKSNNLDAVAPYWVPISGVPPPGIKIPLTLWTMLCK